MTVESGSGVIPRAVAAKKPRAIRVGSRLWRGARRNPNMAYGLTIVTIMGLIAILAPLLHTVDPVRPKPTERFIAPSSARWFGTDHIGRDVFSRTLYGSRVSLAIGAAVSAIAITAGGLLGAAAGYDRKADMIIMRVMDGLMAIPSILLGIALMAALGGSVQNVIIALSVTETPIAVRIVRSSVLSIREMVYVDAARTLGAKTWRILLRHILPNVVAPLIVQGTFIASSAILLEAYLSFLGAGTPPGIPSWGIMMADGQKYITVAIWVITFPGIFLTLTVLGISLAGDGLRDNLDPKLRRRM